MLRDIKLGQKLTILLIGIFLSIILLCSIFLSLILERNAEQVIADEANLLMQTMLSIRNYTST